MHTLRFILGWRRQLDCPNSSNHINRKQPTYILDRPISKRSCCNSYDTQNPKTSQLPNWKEPQNKQCTLRHSEQYYILLCQMTDLNDYISWLSLYTSEKREDLYQKRKKYWTKNFAHILCFQLNYETWS